MYPLNQFLKRAFFNSWVGLCVFICLVMSLSHFVFSLSVTEFLRQIGSLIFSREAGVLAAVGGGILSLYQFVYLRPELLLDVEAPEGYLQRDSEDDGQYEAVISLLLINAGNRFAEDVQLTFTLDAFEFDKDLDTSDYPGEDYEIPDTTMDVRSGRRIGFIGGGRRHDIFFENTIYEEDVHRLFYDDAVFRSESRHEIKYSVACQSHGLRKGKIILELEDGEITMTREYPTLRRQLKAYLGWSPDLKRTESVENLEDVDISINSIEVE